MTQLPVSMKISDLNGKNICILGYGKEGQATVVALEKYAPDVEITIADKNPDIKIQNAKHWKQLGEGWLENLEKFDVLIKSPGIPPNAQIKAQSSKLTTPTQIFLDFAATHGALTIGVTGSKGKSTTSSMIAHILKTAGEDAHLVGNIGDPAIAHLENVERDAIFVLEMSSYQLMDLKTAPSIAVITSFFPEHLDYHGSLEAYHDAKAKITTLQKKGDIVFYADTEGVRPMIGDTIAKKIPITAADAPVSLSETKLIGEHNLCNMALAAAVTTHIGIDKIAIGEAMRSFAPLPHRLQSLGVLHGIEWVDDAISTTPDSTIAAIEALGPRLKVVILGGQDRGLDFANMGKVINASEIETVILYGESGNRIAASIANKTIEHAKSMEDVIKLAMEAVTLRPMPHAQPTITLLSPASPSYDSYANFEEKGADFRNAIESLQKN